jgi:O-antigen/teichoic acid export membrane protein
MLKNTLIALQGTVVAQCIAFLFLPLLTRIYTPEAFGTYQVYMSILSLALVVAALRYDTAILASKKNGEQQALVRLCIALSLLTATFVFIICVCLMQLRPVWLIIPDTALQLLAAATLAGGILQTFGFVLLHEQAIAINSVSKVVQVVLFCVAGLIATVHSPQSGLIGADVISRVATAALIVTWLAHNRTSVFLHVATTRIAEVARHFHEYPMLALPGGLLTAAMGFVVPILMFSAFGETVMGQYALVERTVLLPAGLIGQTVGQVFTAQLSESVEKQQVNLEAFKKVGLTMLGLGILPAVGLLAFAPTLFKLAFGAQWGIAGTFAQVLSAVFLSSLIMSPFHLSLVVVNRQREQFSWELVRIFVIVTAWILIIKGALQPMQAIIIHATIVTLMNLIFVLLVYRALRIQRDSNCNL